MMGRRVGADDAPDRYRRLEAWGSERFPAMREVQFRWSGQVVEPIDNLGVHWAQPTGCG